VSTAVQTVLGSAGVDMVMVEIGPGGVVVCLWGGNVSMDEDELDQIRSKR